MSKKKKPVKEVEKEIVVLPDFVKDLSEKEWKELQHAHNIIKGIVLFDHRQNYFYPELLKRIYSYRLKGIKYWILEAYFKECDYFGYYPFKLDRLIKELILEDKIINKCKEIEERTKEFFYKVFHGKTLDEALNDLGKK